MRQPLKRVLITGASGFIGTRLCERMAQEYRLPFRALVRDSRKARASKRSGGEVAIGDLLDPQQARSALDGCDSVVHLAHGEDDEAPRATQNLVRASTELEIQRFVHISSMSVHGPAPGPLCAREETATIGRYDDSYCDSKAEEEQIVRRAMGELRLPGVVLRPTVVYGPRAPFVSQVVAQARSGVVTLIDGGRGVCNAVFIDDVCDAIHAALLREGALGQALFVSGPEPISWKDFVEAFAFTVTPAPRVEDVSSASARQHWAEKVRPSVPERLLRRLYTLPGARAGMDALLGALTALHPRAGAAASSRLGVDRWPVLTRVERETVSVAFCIENARRILGWNPEYSFQRGAEVTRAWLRGQAR